MQECYTNSLLATVEFCLSNHAYKYSEDICSTDSGRTRNVYKILVGKYHVKIPLGKFGIH
jgi:hypothetical protein